MNQIISAKDKYTEIAIPEMKKEFSYANNLAIPKINKVILNVGIGKIYKEADRVEEIINFLRDVSGQKPVKTKAKKAISGFKIRDGLEIGVKTTLRGKRMWNFIDRLVNFALPRTKDFQGITSSSVDDGGNLNIGIREHIIFPEVVLEKVKNIFSFQIVVVSSAKSKKEGEKLFKLIGFPLK